MFEKYEFTGKNGGNLKQLRALRDFGNIKKGDLGGWIEGEHNLSHEGNCWVFSFAQVFNNALVRGNAKVFGHAWVYGGA